MCSKLPNSMQKKKLSFQMSSFATYQDKIFVLFSNGTLEARSLPGIKNRYFLSIVKIILCVGCNRESC